MIKASLVVLDQVRVENTKLPLLFQTKISLIILTRWKRDDKIITPPIKASCYGSRPRWLTHQSHYSGTVAQWLERCSYKAVVEGSIPSSPTYLVPLPTKASCYGSRPVVGLPKPFLVPLPIKASLRSRPR